MNSRPASNALHHPTARDTYLERRPQDRLDTPRRSQPIDAYVPPAPKHTRDIGTQTEAPLPASLSERALGAVSHLWEYFAL